MNGYERDIGLERRFARTIKAILGCQFIGQEPVADKDEGTDFLTYTVAPIRVGVRLRRYKFWLNTQYRSQFTLRWSRPSGVPTEIDKVRSGFVHHLLYGFVDSTERNIVQYFIGSFGVFRQVEPKPLAVFPNKPRDSELAVFGLDQFPPDFVVKWWQKPLAPTGPLAFERMRACM